MAESNGDRLAFPLPLPDNLGELKLILRATESFLAKIEDADALAIEILRDMVDFNNWLDSGRTDIKLTPPTSKFPRPPVPPLEIIKYAQPLDEGLAKHLSSESDLLTAAANEALAKGDTAHPLQLIHLLHSRLSNELVRLSFPAQDLYVELSEKLATIERRAPTAGASNNGGTKTVDAAPALKNKKRKSKWDHATEKCQEWLEDNERNTAPPIKRADVRDALVAYKKRFTTRDAPSLSVLRSRLYRMASEEKDSSND